MSKHEECEKCGARVNIAESGDMYCHTVYGSSSVCHKCTDIPIGVDA